MFVCNNEDEESLGLLTHMNTYLYMAKRGVSHQCIRREFKSSSDWHFLRP